MSGLFGVSRRNRNGSVSGSVSGQVPGQVPGQRQLDAAGFADIAVPAGRPGLTTHRWLVGSQSAVASWLAGAPPRTLGAIPGHARLRGPFTAAGTLMREVAPAMLANHTDLVRCYGSDMLATAPDLAWVLGPARPAGHHSHNRARQVAESLGALTLAYAAQLGPRHTLAVLDADCLDGTDALWLADLLGHADPDRLQIVVATSTGAVPAPLAAVLAGRTVRTDVSSPRVRKPLGSPPSQLFLARAFVATECLSDDPGLRAAYAALDPAARADLHDNRALRLETLGDPSLRLGAIAYHRERGSAPGAGVAALSYAVTECFRAGWYCAAVEFGDRLRTFLGPDGKGLELPHGD